MKNSKILRGICYILLPILIAIVILSSFYVVAINEKSFTSKEEFFNGRNFKSAYMNRIHNEMDELIFADDDYRTIQDGQYTIYFTNPYPIYGIENCGNFLIIYKNKAITNIPFKEETNTIEEIKNYILEKNEINLCYENNQFTSNKEGFVDNYVENFLMGDTFTYYTNNENKNMKSTEVEEEYYDANGNVVLPGDNYVGAIYSYDENGVLRIAGEAPDAEEVPEEVGVTATLTENSVNNSSTLQSSDVSKVTYHTATLEEFTFYTSFNPELEGNSDICLVIETMEILKPYEQQITIAMPVSGILTLIICIYLINAIGHEKGKNEVELTDFDKVPLEIIILVIFLVVALLAVMVEECVVDIVENKDTFFTLITTMYAILAIMLEVFMVTCITRIKAKKFLDTCICGKLFKWSITIISKVLDILKRWLSKILNSIKKVKKEISANIKLTWKVIFAICSYIVISIILIAMFGVGFGIILDGFLLVFVIFQIIARVNSFIKLEAGLKEIYEGNNKVRLYKDDFSKEFENCVDYVNDISNGFENAVEEGLKSERLKTELITNVSHDIKTPLTSIINYVDLIKKENIDNEKLKEYVDILDNKSQRLKKLTEDLVEASKASSGNVSLNLEEIGLIELLNQLIGEYKDKFEEKNLEVVTNLSKVNLKIKADSRYLYRVIDNLFGNISKYALEGSRVYVETEIVDGGRVKMILKNISKDKLNISEEELMQRFVRGDKSRTTEGSGLGLAIARSLTELQKGTLNCKIDGDLFKVEVEFDII